MPQRRLVISVEEYLDYCDAALDDPGARPLRALGHEVRPHEGELPASVAASPSSYGCRARATPIDGPLLSPGSSKARRRPLSVWTTGLHVGVVDMSISKAPFAKVADEEQTVSGQNYWVHYVSLCPCVTDRAAHEGLAVWQAGDLPSQDQDRRSPSGHLTGEPHRSVLLESTSWGKSAMPEFISEQLGWLAAGPSRRQLLRSPENPARTCRPVPCTISPSNHCDRSFHRRLCSHGAHA